MSDACHDNRMTTKEGKIEVRVTLAELRAVRRMAKGSGKSVSDLVRARVVNPALSYDPKQVLMPLINGGPNG